jgi:hypothetical protein
MALYGSARDASLIRHLNKELINEYIDTEISFYKLNLESSRTNIYNESDNKVYYGKLRINCLILKQPKDRASDEYGVDYTRTGRFAFLRDTLTDRNIRIEEGDIIEYDGEYFEIDNVSSNQYWAGKNPSRDLGYTQNDRSEFGYSVSVICDAHVTRRNSLNIEPVRAGINRPNDIPRNL